MKKWLGRAAGALCIIVILGVVVVFLGFQASLPLIEGSVEAPTLIDKVILERDDRGHATLTASNRNDLSYTTGFVHAQERFFQMDLSRRLAAGELSELFGAVALNSDREKRLHRFRDRATIAIDLLPSDQKDLLNQYVDGVNAGLKALRLKPFEYWLLSSEPKEWRAEDSLLVLYSMYFTLQNSRGEFEWQNHLLNKYLPSSYAEFLLPKTTEWDAPLQNSSQYIPMTIPSHSMLKEKDHASQKLIYDDTPMLGSSNWAVSGALTKTGSAIMANDMHLSIRAPSIWFKLRLKLNDGSLDISGVSLPGTPVIVVGSNGSVAWGFTNSNIDTSDIIDLKINPDNENQYLTSKGYIDFEYIEEPIKIKNNPIETLIVKETIWGPVINMSDDKEYAYRWVAHMPEAANLGLIAMEHAKTVDDALMNASKMGIPAQNAMIADDKGNIAWTIFGKIPRRKFGNYQKIMDWSDGTGEWDGWYDSIDYPKILNPDQNRLWTANNRVVDGAYLNRVGYNRYDLGARAKQISDNLFALQSDVSEQDLYNIMLDNRAVFLARWQKQLVGILQKASGNTFQPYLGQVNDWGGYADKNSIGFRLVREYRHKVFEVLMGESTSVCTRNDATCDYGRATKQWEGPLWQLITQQPDDWLPAQFENWQSFFESMAIEAWLPVQNGEVELNEYTWGNKNKTQIKHPLSNAIPLLGILTDMPEFEQSGDTENIPHISGAVSGQSERIVVSPGHEEEGIMNLPTGQSGHPLSPYYGAGHEDWALGNMTPFLPQETKWKLEFIPAP